MDNIKAVWTENVSDHYLHKEPGVISSLVATAFITNHIYFPSQMLGGDFKWGWAEPLADAGKASFIRLKNPMIPSGYDQAYPYPVTDPWDISEEFAWDKKIMESQILHAITHEKALTISVDKSILPVQDINHLEINQMLKIVAQSSIAFNIPNISFLTFDDFIEVFEKVTQTGELIEYKAYLLELISGYAERITQGIEIEEVTKWANIIAQTKIQAALVKLELKLKSVESKSRFLTSNIGEAPEILLNPLKWGLLPKFLKELLETINFPAASGRGINPFFVCIRGKPRGIIPQEIQY